MVLVSCKPGKDTNRLLLTVATNAFNTGQIFDTKAQHVCMESGNHPALIESVSVSVSLSNGRAKAPRMWALHFNGERAEEVAVRQEDGVLKMDLDTSALTHGAGFFEIVYE